MPHGIDRAQPLSGKKTATSLSLLSPQTSSAEGGQVSAHRYTPQPHPLEITLGYRAMPGETLHH